VAAAEGGRVVSEWSEVVRLDPRASGVFAILACGHERLLTILEVRRAKKTRGRWVGGRANGYWAEPSLKLPCWLCCTTDESA
jgi:hypothetical protein